MTSPKEPSLVSHHITMNQFWSKTSILERGREFLMIPKTHDSIKRGGSVEIEKNVLPTPR